MPAWYQSCSDAASDATITDAAVTGASITGAPVIGAAVIDIAITHTMVVMLLNDIQAMMILSRNDSRYC